MNRLPFGIGDFLATFKGDTPGHPFRGNQFEGGSGSGESSHDVEGAIEKIAQHNQRQNELEQFNKTHVKPNDKVSTWVHTSAMARQSGKPKVKVTGRVTSIDTNDKNEQIARIEFEHGGKTGSAWINTAQDKWQKE